MLSIYTTASVQLDVQGDRELEQGLGCRYIRQQGTDTHPFAAIGPVRLHMLILMMLTLTQKCAGTHMHAHIRNQTSTYKQKHMQSISAKTKRTRKSSCVMAGIVGQASSMLL